jgi:polysaccharide deacetylase 2 family uncharacterized protein YibQ
MAMDSVSDPETLGGVLKVRRINLLVLASAMFIALLVLTVLVVARYGNAYAARPMLSIDMPLFIKGNFPPEPWSGPVHSPNHKPPAAPQAAGTGGPPAATGNASKAVYAGKALIADPALIEQTKEGPLPRIADDGRKPMDAYAPPVAAVGSRHRIAVVMMGLGLSEKATAAAIKALPPAVTLAFAPQVSDVQAQVNAARQAGHEVLLQVPMEAYDTANNDTGPHTLRAGLGEDANTTRLIWALTRFTGYTGITNLMGARFLATRENVSPVMTFLSRRGLMFYDDGSAASSRAAEAAGVAGTAFVQGAFTIDTIANPADIDRALSNLEMRARSDGRAAATATLLPATVERLANWAKGLSSRGFVLVPASAIVAEAKQ